MAENTSLRLDGNIAEESHLAEVRAALLAGEQSGEPMAFDFDAFTASKKSGSDPTRHV
ncbi:MAG: type II toxin-antitoxin system ParD family antitoxin [Leifsonia sp.]